MDITNFKTKLFDTALKNGFSQCELYFTSGKSFSVNIYKGEVEKYKNSQCLGISFRGLYNNVMGYSFTEIIDDNSIINLIEDAKSNSLIIDNNYKEELFSGDKNYTKVDKYNEDINNLTVSEKINFAKTIEKKALSYDKRIVNCTSCTISNSEGEVQLFNTKGLELSKKSNYISAYVSVIAKDGEQIKSGSEVWAGFSIDTFDPTFLAEKASKKALSYLGATSISFGSKKICFENKCFAELMGAFINNFYAENVQKGFSLLKNKINKSIASDNITIVDEPLLKNGYSSTSFDSEGVASYDKTLVENGTLKGYLYNLKTAEKDGVKSTGNGFKNSYKSSVSTSFTNLYIKSGNTKLEKLLKNIDNGIFITSLSGLHSGTNNISGDFSLLAQGFLIKNGTKTSPIEQITVAGNFFDLLKNIVTVCDDLKFLTNGLGSPSIFVGELNISGS